VQDSEESHQHSNVGEHDAERNHGDALSDDVVDEEVAAAGQRCSHQAWDASYTAHVQSALRGFKFQPMTFAAIQSLDP